MNLKDLLKKIFGEMNLTDDQKRVAEEKIANVPDEDSSAQKNGSNAGTDSKLQAQVEALTAQTEQLKKLLGDEIAARTAATEAMKLDNEQKRGVDIKAILDKAVADGKFPADSPDRRAIWERQFKADFEGAKRLLEGVPSAAKTPGSTTPSGTTKEVKGTNPATGLETLRENAAAAFTT